VYFDVTDVSYRH